MTTAVNEVVVCYVESDVLDLARRFLKRQRRSMDALKRAVGLEEFEVIRKTGHDLKGSGGAYGLDALSQLGTELETAAGAQNGDRVELLVARLEQQISSIELRAVPGEPQVIATDSIATGGSHDQGLPVTRE